MNHPGLTLISTTYYMTLKITFLISYLSYDFPGNQLPNQAEYQHHNPRDSHLVVLPCNHLTCPVPNLQNNQSCDPQDNHLNNQHLNHRNNPQNNRHDVLVMNLRCNPVINRHDNLQDVQLMNPPGLKLLLSYDVYDP